MTGWVIVIIQDGIANPLVFGDSKGGLFPDKHSAEEAASTFRVAGASYSVYTREVGKL